MNWLMMAAVLSLLVWMFVLNNYIDKRIYNIQQAVILQNQIIEQQSKLFVDFHKLYKKLTMELSNKKSGR